MANIYVQHYITFCMGNRGILLEYETYSIAERDPLTVVLPEGAIGFQFSDRTEIVEKKRLFLGAEENKSGWYWCGKRYTLDEVRQHFPEETDLIANMKGNKTKTVVKTSYGRWMPLSMDDTVLGENK